jgi:hypothetical protein
LLQLVKLSQELHLLLAAQSYRDSVTSQRKDLSMSTPQLLFLEQASNQHPP